MAILNEDILKGKWKEIKGEIRNQWGKLTSDEVEQTKGNLSAITGLIQQKYGMKKEEVSDRLHEFMNRFEVSKDRGAEEFKSKVAEKTEDVKNTLRDRQ